MRIVGGDLSGRKIPNPKRFDARPTTDVAKESLFNILNNDYYFDEIVVLDLFAGSGSISYEFASRGTESITSVEKNSIHANFIEQTAEFLGLEGIIVLNTDAFKFMELTSMDYDVIFADPPYGMENVEKIPEIIFEKKLLKKNGVFILEHSKHYSFKNHAHFKREKRYGKVHFTFFE